MLSEKTFDNFINNGLSMSLCDKKQKIINNVTKLFCIINKHTKNYLLKEKNFFNKYSTDKTDFIVQSVDSLINQIPEDNSYCILKMSAGSGFHSITGDWQFDDYCGEPLNRKENNSARPKSRKIAIIENMFSLMGFVKLRILSDEEKQSMQAEKNEKRQFELELIEKEQQAKEKKEREDRKRIAQEKELKEQYYSIVSEAKDLQKNEQYEFALTKYKEAEVLYPNGTLHKKPIEDLKLTVSSIIRKREEKQRLEQIELEHQQMLKQRAESGLSALLDEKYELGSNLGKYKVIAFKVCANKVKYWMKAAKVESLPNDQMSALKETIIRLHNNCDKKRLKYWNDFEGDIWTTIKKWIDEDTARNWYDEIINM